MKIFLIILAVLIASKVMLKAVFPYTNKALNDKIKDSKVVKPLIMYYNYCKIWW
jgi:hypothetical protein